MAKPKTAANINVPDEVLRSLLTPSELRMLKNRWTIVNLLEEGLSIRKISARVGVGTDTVVRVARMMEKGDLKRRDNKQREFKTQTPWIFGKSD